VWQPGGASAYSSLPVVFFLLALRSLAVFIFCLSSLAATFIFFLLLALRSLAVFIFCLSSLAATFIFFLLLGAGQTGGVVLLRVSVDSR
jgi:hypothetical protein